MLQATLFDFNGVLVDDARLHLDGFNAALRPLAELGLDRLEPTRRRHATPRADLDRRRRRHARRHQ